jgi:hypothetical protein
MVEWNEVKRKPNAGIPVLVSDGKTIMRACYIPQYFVTDHEDFLGRTEYSEEKDEFYWPEGWYEWNHIEETHWLIDSEVTHWANLPELP